MSNNNEVFGRVLRVISTFPKVDQDNLQLDTKFKDVGLDSLTLVEVTLALEDEFHIKVPDADLDGLEDLAGVVRIVEKNMVT